MEIIDSKLAAWIRLKLSGMVKGICENIFERNFFVGLLIKENPLPSTIYSASSVRVQEC